MRVRIVGLRAAPLLTVALAVVTAVTACSYSVVVQSPTPAPVGPGIATEVPLEPTPWPNGTIGAYGLRIDPGLLSNIPSIVGGNPLVEDVAVESAALDDSHYATAFSAYYVAHIGSITDINYVEVGIGALKDEAQSQDFYTAWRDDWFKAACSQAGGIGSTGKDSINDLPFDVATCTGGVNAYTLSVNNGILLSIIDLGPRRLGRELIQGIN
jgi:hypothetical protein